jgi:hypothetical protein
LDVRSTGETPVPQEILKQLLKAGACGAAPV